MTRDPRLSAVPLVIVGGGASGVLLAAHVLTRAPDMRVVLIEPAAALGCGIAYATQDPDHLLNTRVGNMSAFADDPQHFRRWLKAECGVADGQGFVSRATYGRYLRDLIAPWLAPAGDGRLRVIRDRCVAVEDTGTGMIAHLADAGAVAAEHIVLATGHVVPAADRDSLLTGAWQDAGGADPEGTVVIVGSGLSMVDQVVSALNSGHRGPIITVSRRGLVPRTHEDTAPLAIPPAEVPLAAPVSRILHWARGIARQAQAAGGTWRDAVDGIRPHARALWQAMTTDERARFLRHGATWWDVHRHRMPPETARRLGDAIARRQVVLRRGAFAGASRDDNGQLLCHLRGAGPIAAVRIVDCRGIRRDPVQNLSPLVADLLLRGLARVDPLRIGLDVDGDCRVIGGDGAASARLLAIGPASRAAFWEITAIPDIREQAARLSRVIAQPVAA